MQCSAEFRSLARSFGDDRSAPLIYLPQIRRNSRQCGSESQSEVPQVVFVQQVFERIMLWTPRGVQS